LRADHGMIWTGIHRGKSRRNNSNRLGKHWSHGVPTGRRNGEWRLGSPDLPPHRNEAPMALPKTLRRLPIKVSLLQTLSIGRVSHSTYLRVERDERVSLYLSHNALPYV
jgi:hypothetical protein